MFYVLSYRDMAKDEMEGEGYRNITNILGDIYYHAGLYNQAGTIYSELLQQYEKDGNFDHYRPYVLMNNLGQIALKEHSYFEAAQWFSQSLELARKHLNASYKTNTMAYTMLKLAQTALDAGRYQEADRWLSMVDSLPNRLVHTDVQSEWRFLKGRLLLVNNQPHEALCMLTGGLSLDSLKNRGGEVFSRCLCVDFAGLSAIGQLSDGSGGQSALPAPYRFNESTRTPGQVHGNSGRPQPSDFAGRT